MSSSRRPVSSLPQSVQEMLRIDQLASGTRRLVTADGAVVLARCHVADRPVARAVGLLATRRLEPGEGVWLAPCGSVHMLGMRFAIAVLFLDAEGRVIGRRERLRPWRLARAAGARVAVEGPVGAFDGVADGAVLHLVD